MNNDQQAKVVRAQQLLDTLLNLRFECIDAIKSFLPKDGSSVVFHLNMFDPYSFPTWEVDLIRLSIHGAEITKNGKVERIPFEHIQQNDLAYFLGELAGLY